jgi:hypothetical protein
MLLSPDDDEDDEEDSMLFSVWGFEVNKAGKAIC